MRHASAKFFAPLTVLKWLPHKRNVCSNAEYEIFSTENLLGKIKEYCPIPYLYFGILKARMSFIFYVIFTSSKWLRFILPSQIGHLFVFSAQYRFYLVLRV